MWKTNGRNNCSFPLSECACAHMGQRCPKYGSHGLWLVSGFREEVQLIPQVQSGHCVSTRSRPGRSRCCCCHDSFNKQEHFEPLWLGLSNKSKHGQLLIDYIFQEHDMEGCFHWWMIVFSNPLPSYNWTGYCINFIWVKMFMQHTFSSKHYNLSISPQDCCSYCCFYQW